MLLAQRQQLPSPPEILVRKPVQPRCRGLPGTFDQCPQGLTSQADSLGQVAVEVWVVAPDPSHLQLPIADPPEQFGQQPAYLAAWLLPQQSASRLQRRSQGGGTQQGAQF